MDKPLFLVADKNMYYYPHEEVCICPIVPSFANRVLRQVCRKTNQPFPEEMMHPLLRKGRERIIIFTDFAFFDNFPILPFLKRTYGQDHIILYYMNHISPKSALYMQHFSKVCCFDRKDAEKYHIHYVPLPYTNYYNPENTIVQIQQDAIFLGQNKGRERKLLVLKKELEANGFHTRFMMTGTGNSELCLKKKIPYDDYIQMVKSSRCVVELMMEDQAGYTLRAMEALFLRKKLITDNVSVIHEPWYNKRNIFLLGKDGLEDLSAFITTPYSDTGFDLHTLNFSEWIDTYDWKASQYEDKDRSE